MNTVSKILNNIVVNQDLQCIKILYIITKWCTCQKGKVILTTESQLNVIHHINRIKK